MPCKASYYGNRKPGAGVRPISTETPPKIPFNAPKYPVNPWTGKHMPLHKDTATSDLVSMGASTVRLFWRMSTGGDWIEQSMAPTNVSGYFWVMDHESDDSGEHSFYMIESPYPAPLPYSTLRLFWTDSEGHTTESNDSAPDNTPGYYWGIDHRIDANGEHSVYMVERAFPSETPLTLYWNGVASANRPATPAGMIWEVVSVTGHAIYNESRCLSWKDIPGNSPVTGSITLGDDTFESADFSFTDGYCDAPEGTVIVIGTGEGTTTQVTVGASGELVGYVGVIAVGDPDTGTTSFYRISSGGRLEQ